MSLLLGAMIIDTVVVLNEAAELSDGHKNGKMYKMGLSLSF